LAFSTDAWLSGSKRIVRLGFLTLDLGAGQCQFLGGNLRHSRPFKSDLSSLVLSLLFTVTTKVKIFKLPNFTSMRHMDDITQLLTFNLSLNVNTTSKQLQSLCGDPVVAPLQTHILCDKPNKVFT